MCEIWSSNAIKISYFEVLALIIHQLRVHCKATRHGASADLCLFLFLTVRDKPECVQMPRLVRCFADLQRTRKTGPFPSCHQETPHKGKTNTVHLSWDQVQALNNGSDPIFPATSSYGYTKISKVGSNEMNKYYTESMSNNTGWVVAQISADLWQLSPWGWDVCSWGGHQSREHDVTSIPPSRIAIQQPLALVLWNIHVQPEAIFQAAGPRHLLWGGFGCT